MKVKQLKELLNGTDDELEIFIRNTFNICGNISEFAQIELSTYGFFGTSIQCVIFNSAHSESLDVDDQGYILNLINRQHTATERKG